MYVVAATIIVPRNLNYKKIDIFFTYQGIAYLYSTYTILAFPFILKLPGSQVAKVSRIVEQKEQIDLPPLFDLNQNHDDQIEALQRH